MKYEELKESNVKKVIHLCNRCHDNNNCVLGSENYCEAITDVIELAEKAALYDTLDLSIEEIKLQERNRIIDLINDSNIDENAKISLVELIKSE